jgi:hypothetical protein
MILAPRSDGNHQQGQVRAGSSVSEQLGWLSATITDSQPSAPATLHVIRGAAIGLRRAALSLSLAIDRC